nr:MAG TPA: hypothetical protein [Caudoviricetes sp.]
MTEREKLIEILSTKIHSREGIDPAAVVADFLLDHDVLPVARCGVCDYTRRPKTLIAAGRWDVFRCDNTRSPCYGRVTYGDDFCSRGTRKEDKP